jgi:transposase
MEKAWLEARLAEGRSIQAIADEAGKGASTVGYWINKHGLTAAGRAKHSAKGPIDELTLRALVERGLSTREIATELDRSYGTVRHWLRQYGLETQPSRYRRGPEKPDAVLRECATHGWTTFQLAGVVQQYRCGACNVERVARRRRTTKQTLIEEFGGCCVLCGYDRHPGALQFHHVDRATKRFEIGGRGLARSLDTLREEARRCVLLCATCHAEVEAGVTRLPFAPVAPDRK